MDNPAMELTEDLILGGRLRLIQPRNGFRAAIDPILLAAAVPALAGQRVLDLGTGTGAAALCLARRVPGVQVTGLDLQADLIALAQENARLNQIQPEAVFWAGDLLTPPPDLPRAGFDHVMANPPYLESGKASLPSTPARALAVAEGAADLKAWVDAALAFVRPQGMISFIHRADRLDGLLAALFGRAGAIQICPLWPGVGKAARRVLVRARRAAQTPLILSAGLVLHDSRGDFTPEAQAILQEARALSFD